MAKDYWEKALDKLLAELPLSDAERKLVDRFRVGPLLEEADSGKIVELALEYGRTRWPSVTRQELKRRTREALENPQLDWDLAFQEVLLRRLVSDPGSVIQHIDRKHKALGKRNSLNAKEDRPGRQSWWTEHVGDCLDDDSSATPEKVISYLIQTDDVEWQENRLCHIKRKADPITRTQLRSIIQSAKKKRGPAG